MTAGTQTAKMRSGGWEASLGALKLNFQWDYCGANGKYGREWGVYLTLARRHKNVVYLKLGDGVVPF